VFLSFKVIEPTHDKGLLADYVTNRSFDDQYFKDMIIKYIKIGGKVKRKDIDALIIPKLSAVLTDDQKKNKVINLLSALRMEKKLKALPGYFWTIP